MSLDQGVTTPAFNQSVANFTEPSQPAPTINANQVFFNFIVNVCIDGFLCVSGYICNAMIIVVLQHDKTRTSNSIFLQALAVFDSMFLTYVVFYVVLRSIPPYTGGMQGYVAINAYIVAFVLPFGWTSQTCTIWIVMIIAIDRYLVVSRPFKAAIWCTPTNAKRVVAAMFTTAVLFNFPRWLHYYFVAFGNQAKGAGTFVAHQSLSVTVWNEKLYRKIYHQSMGFIFLFIIPLTVICVLNFLLAMAIKESMKSRKAMTNNVEQAKDKKEQPSLNHSVMLVVLITIFVVCELPDFIASIIGAISKIPSHIYIYYAPVKEGMLVLNSAINFTIYFIFYRRFRNIFLGLVGCGSPDAPSRPTTSTGQA